MKLTNFGALTFAFASLATGVFAQANLSAESPSPGGASYLSSAHLTEVAGTAGIANIQLADGQTLTNSLQNVAEGKTDIAGGPYILQFLMMNGVGPFGALGKEKGAELASNLRVIVPFTMGTFALYAYDAKGVGGWDDLKGRKIYNGPPRGGALNNARNILQIVAGLKEGDDYEGIQVNWGQQAATTLSGEPDVMLLPDIFPSSTLATVASAGKLTAWSVPKDRFEAEAFQKYLTAPGIAPFVVSIAEFKATMGDDWTFVSEDDTFRTASTVGGNVVHKDMDEQLAYDLVAAYVATIEDLKSKAPFGKTVGFDDPMQGMCGRNPAKFHPGAARAWRDAGFTIDDCAVGD